ncbi:MAG: hypothetical protein ABGX53_00895 [Candidatus Thioglobus sp.]
MVLKLPSLIFLILLSVNVFADDDKTQSDSVIDNIETISYDLLELEDQLDMGMNTFDIKIEARNIRSQLLYQEHKLGTPRGGDEQWNESEMAILNAKKNLQALEEKIKLEGDWGKIRFRMLDLKGSDPGSIKLRYNYGF